MITVDTGERLRPATLSDEQAIYESLRDWPAKVGRLTMSEVAHNIRYSIEAFEPAMFTQAPIPHIRFAITVMEDSASDFVGLCEWTFHPGEHSGFDIHRLAIHPDQRGKGYFPLFSDGIAYLANQILKAEGARFDYYAQLELPDGTPVEKEDRLLKDHILAGQVEAIERDTPLKTLRDHLGGSVLAERPPDKDARLNAVQLERQTVESRLFKGGSRFTLRIA